VGRAFTFNHGPRRFTLADLVSYKRQTQPWPTGEDKPDGANHKQLEYGVEGPCKTIHAITPCATAAAPNLLGHLLLAPGVPMLLMGDEVAAAARGANNKPPGARTIPSVGCTGGFLHDAGDLALRQVRAKLLVFAPQIAGLLSTRSSPTCKASRGRPTAFPPAGASGTRVE